MFAGGHVTFKPWLDSNRFAQLSREFEMQTRPKIQSIGDLPRHLRLRSSASWELRRHPGMG
jgi:hypothetical protein